MVSAVLSVSSLLITFHHSLLEIGFFFFFSSHTAHQGRIVRGRRATGGGVRHHQRSRRSIHDIRLNEYMNSNESRPRVVLTSGPPGLSPGSAEVRVEVGAGAQPQRDGGTAAQIPLSYRNDESESSKSLSVVQSRGRFHVGRSELSVPTGGEVLMFSHLCLVWFTFAGPKRRDRVRQFERLLAWGRREPEGALNREKPAQRY